MSDTTIFVIASRVKELNKEAGFNTSAEYLESLSEAVKSLVLRGQERARQNGRKTLKAQDA